MQVTFTVTPGFFNEVDNINVTISYTVKVRPVILLALPATSAYCSVHQCLLQRPHEAIAPQTGSACNRAAHRHGSHGQRLPRDIAFSSIG